jgi:transcriptional regulator with XRE-family HTH domain
VNTQSKVRPAIREVLALNLKYLRGERGLSQDALALVAGLDRTFVAHVERLKRNISLDNLEKLAVALNVPVADLLTDNLREKDMSRE